MWLGEKVSETLEVTQVEQNASLAVAEDQQRMTCVGSWTVYGIRHIAEKIERMRLPAGAKLTLVGDQLVALDTAGAWLLVKLMQRLQTQDSQIEWQHFNPEHESLLNLVLEQAQTLSQPGHPEKPNLIAAIGIWSVNTKKLMVEFLAFLGETFIASTRSLLQPQKLRWRALASTIETAGYHAILIVGVLSFLIGMVLVYQMGLELQNYGASIYVADLLGLTLLREFSPLITAIIVAGRTGSAFTAQIGTMKVNEEVDALRTLGLSPTEMLLLPRMLGLIVVLPLLTIVSEIFGVFGGMIVSKDMLGISYVEFLHRFQEVIPLRVFLFGLIKVPIFAIIISSVGCFQGLKVSGSAESVGQRTTISVVHSIFLIITADALISVIYSWYGI